MPPLVLRTLTALLFTTPLALAAQDLGIKIGAVAPAAMVEGLDGAPVDLAKYIGKRPVLIEFWATWCENCKALEPRLLAAQRQFGDRVRFVGVAVSVNESPELVRRYVERHGIRHDILYDRSGDASEAYDVPATSYVVIVDKNGKVVYTGLGGDQDLDAALRKLP
jgi:thiol-disulfide isomerase/thioredoxin